MQLEPGEALTKWKKGLEILKGLPVRAGRGHAALTLEEQWGSGGTSSFSLL